MSRTARQGEETRPCRVSVCIPARYAVRPSWAQRVVPFLLIPCGLFLLAACLSETPPYDPFYTWVILDLGALVALGVWFLLFFRQLTLTVEGDTLTCRRRGREEEVFSFAAVGYVLSRRGRETVVLYDGKRQVLCRLSTAMEGLDVLLADLQSRGALFLERPPRSRDLPGAPLVPGPRKTVQELDLPALVPACYRLAPSALARGIFWLGGAFFAGGLALSAAARQFAASFGFLIFLAGDFAALGFLRRQGVEVRGDDLLCRGRVFFFSDVKAARVRTYSTGVGPISTVQLLDREGNVLLAPDPMLAGAEFLLADLTRRGIPFTY